MRYEQNRVVVLGVQLFRFDFCVIQISMLKLNFIELVLVLIRISPISHQCEDTEMFALNR